jgi:hypothetical protein
MAEPQEEISPINRSLGSTDVFSFLTMCGVVRDSRMKKKIEHPAVRFSEHTKSAPECLYPPDSDGYSSPILKIRNSGVACFIFSFIRYSVFNS